MKIPNVLALPLDEAVRRLQAEHFTCDIKSLLPPRDSEADYSFEARKYVVRQQVLSDDRIVLTVVYR